MFYFDTSALVKPYLSEPSSDYVLDLLQTNRTVSTSLLAYTEAVSAFSKANRLGRIDSENLEKVTRAFKNDWPSYLKVSVSDKITKDAAGLATEYELRAYDAIHLSSALKLQSNIRRKTLSFLSFDKKLNNSAKKEELEILEEKD